MKKGFTLLCCECSRKIAETTDPQQQPFSLARLHNLKRKVLMIEKDMEEMVGWLCQSCAKKGEDNA